MVDRTSAAEVVVMLGYREHSLPRHVPATEYVFQKRDDVFLLFRPSEREYEEGIIGLGHRWSHYQVLCCASAECGFATSRCLCSCADCASAVARRLSWRGNRQHDPCEQQRIKRRVRA